MNKLNADNEYGHNKVKSGRQQEKFQNHVSRFKVDNPDSLANTYGESSPEKSSEVTHVLKQSRPLDKPPKPPRSAIKGEKLIHKFNDVEQGYVNTKINIEKSNEGKSSVSRRRIKKDQISPAKFAPIEKLNLKNKKKLRFQDKGLKSHEQFKDQSRELKLDDRTHLKEERRKTTVTKLNTIYLNSISDDEFESDGISDRQIIENETVQKVSNIIELLKIAGFEIESEKKEEIRVKNKATNQILSLPKNI